MCLYKEHYALSCFNTSCEKRKACHLRENASAGLSESELMKIIAVWFGIPLLAMFMLLGVVRYYFSLTDWGVALVAVMGLLGGFVITIHYAMTAYGKKAASFSHYVPATKLFTKK